MNAFFLHSAALGAMCMAAMQAPAAAQTSTQSVGDAVDPSLPKSPKPTVTEPASGDIVVTATRREERLQDVPIAVSALGREQLANLRVTSALDLTNVTPGLLISTGDAAANPKIFIRGVGLSDFNPSSSAGVGVYVDGVYVGSPLAQLAGFYDMARVEVLRGPQGTLFGRNTTGGAINVVSRRPTMAFEGQASMDYGEYNTVNFNAATGGPIIKDVLAFRLSGQLVRDDGTSVNGITGHRLLRQNRYAMRGQLLFTPNDRVELLAQASVFRNRGDAGVVKQRPLFPTPGTPSGPDGLCVGNFYGGGCRDALGYADPSGNPRVVQANIEPKDRVDVITASLNAKVDLGGFDVISITAYQDSWRDAGENTDGSPLRLLEARYRTIQRQFSHELRFQSNGSGGFRWIAGAFYMRDFLRNNSSYDILRDARPLFVTPANPTGVSVANSVALVSWSYVHKVDSYAAFGQVDYDVTERLTLTGGLRWSADEKSMNYVSQAEGGAITFFGYRGNRSFSNWSGRAIMAYRVSPDINAYVSYNRGYKTGGFFGGQATSVVELLPYNDETVNAYEAGIKTSLLGRRLRANLSSFYYDYANQQVFSNEVRNGVTTQVLTNAASSRLWGGELEVSGNPIRSLWVNLSAAYLNTRILDFVSAGRSYTGNVLQQSPKWSLTASATHTTALSNGAAIIINANANWRTRIFFDNTQRQRLSDPNRLFVDAQIGWRAPGGHIEIGAFAKNLFNQVSVIAVSPIDSLGFDSYGFTLPRRAGAYARANF